MLAALRRRRATVALLALTCLLLILGVASSHEAEHEGEVATSHCTACIVAHSPVLATTSTVVAHDVLLCAKWQSYERIAFADAGMVRTEPSRGPPSRV